MLIQTDTKDEEFVPFVREMLQQRPTRHMIKIYAIGSTLAVLGAIAGLIQCVFRPDEPEEDDGAAAPTGAGARWAEARTAPRTETGVRSSGSGKTKGDALCAETRRSCTNRLHAS